MWSPPISEKNSLRNTRIKHYFEDEKLHPWDLVWVLKYTTEKKTEQTSRKRFLGYDDAVNQSE